MPESDGQDPKNGQDPNPNGPDPQGDPNPNPNQDPEKGGGPDPQTFTADYVQKLRNENAGWRTKFQEIDKKFKDLERAQMTEQQKKDADLEEAKNKAAELGNEVKRLRLEVVAANHGAIEPEVAARMVDGTDDDPEKAIQELKKKYPALFKASGSGHGSGDGGSGNGTKPTTTDMNTLLRRAAGRA